MLICQVPMKDESDDDSDDFVPPPKRTTGSGNVMKQGREEQLRKMMEYEGQRHHMTKSF